MEASANTETNCEINLNQEINENLEQQTSEDDWIPKLDMEFESEQSAYDFYNRYAFKLGFGIRWSWKHTLKNSNEAKDRTICCSRQGVPKTINPNKHNPIPQSVLETRCGCLARMKIALNNGVYRVYEFISEHNHPLIKGGHIHRLRSHRKNGKEISRVLDEKCTSNETWDPVKRYKELCAMFIRVAEHAAESEETFSMAKNSASKLLVDVKRVVRSKSKRLIRGDFEEKSSGRKKSRLVIERKEFFQAEEEEEEEGESSEGQWQLSNSSN